MSFVLFENGIGERSHPCGFPVFHAISSDSMGSLDRGPFSLTHFAQFLEYDQDLPHSANLS